MIISKSFGLDISAKSIKAVALTREKNGFLLDSSFLIPTPPKGMLSSNPIDEQEMADALRKVVSHAKIKTKNVNIALPEDKVYTNVVELPILSDNDIVSALHWEAEQYIPVPLSDINLVWSILKKEEKARVLMVGAPTALIKKYQRVVAMAKLNIVSIETEILAVIRALTRDNFPHTLIINIKEEYASLAIIKEDVLMFTYSIPIGGVSINRALEAEFGLSSSESEEYKKIYGISNEGLGGKVRTAIEPILSSMANEVKKAITFYAQKYENNSPIQQVILSGGTAKLPGIDLFFADTLNMETAIANPWEVLLNQNFPKEMLDNAPSYTIAVGLAMRGYE